MAGYTVGIITVPLSPNRKYYNVCGDSYISSAHINMLNRAGLKILAIPYTTKDYDYYIDRVNALYFPSGGVFASNSPEYYNCCKNFLDRAMILNDQGTYFPVWGACMGMQQLMIIADATDNLDLLETFDSFGNLELTLNFPEDPRKSKLFRNIPSDLLVRLQTEKCTLNNHRMGLKPETFTRNPRINSLFKILSTSTDRKGVEFVSTIESRFYPFYGFQWHPERNNEMDYFVNFFASEIKKSPRRKTVPNNKKLQYRNVHCMNYSGNIYKYCRFYWHQRSSQHNKKLCSVLNLGKPVNNSV